MKAAEEKPCARDEAALTRTHTPRTSRAAHQGQRVQRGTNQPCPEQRRARILSAVSHCYLHHPQPRKPGLLDARPLRRHRSHASPSGPHAYGRRPHSPTSNHDLVQSRARRCLIPCREHKQVSTPRRLHAANQVDVRRNGKEHVSRWPQPEVGRREGSTSNRAWHRR